MSARERVVIVLLVLCLGLLAACWQTATPAAVPSAFGVTDPPAPSAATATPPPTAPPASYPVAHGGRTLLFTREDDLWRMRHDGSGQQRLSRGGALPPGKEGTNGLAYTPRRLNPSLLVSPDGRWIAWSAHDSRTWLLDVATLAQRVVFEEDYAYIRLDWAPDSLALAYAILREQPMPDERSWDLQVLDPYTGADEYLIGETGNTSFSRLLWSPDSQSIAYSCHVRVQEPYTGISQSDVYVYDLHTGQVRAAGEMEHRLGTNTYLCWTADGQVTSGWPRDAVQDAARCSPERVYSGVSPDGTVTAMAGSLEYADPPEAGWRVWVFARDGNGATVTQWERKFVDVSLTRTLWSPDGEYLLLDDNEPRSPIWRLRADGTGELERIVEDGFLIDVVAAWE